MGITVFFLICGPFAALLYVPLSTRRQPLRPAHVNVARDAAESTTAAAKDFQPIRWIREAEDHSPRWTNAA